MIGNIKDKKKRIPHKTWPSLWLKYLIFYLLIVINDILIMYISFLKTNLVLSLPLVLPSPTPHLLGF